MNDFGGLGWSRPLDTVNKNEDKHVPEAALLAVSAGAVEFDGRKEGKASGGICGGLVGKSKGVQRV